MSRPAFLFSVLLLIAAAACSSVQASKVLKCKGSSIDVTNKVRISVCEEPPCQLRKRAVPEIRIAFRPDHDINNLVTSVQAQIGGIPFPFIGVDGTSACGKLFKSDGKTKADCPLKKGQDYFYVNSFKVYDQYPKVKLHIRWALKDPNANKMVSCFELPAKITN